MSSQAINKIAVKALLLSTIVAASAVSSFSTYLGFTALLDPTYALGLAVVSGLILISLSYFFSYSMHRTHSFLPQVFITLGIIAMIFTFSTLWSVVGIAKNQLFQELVSETSNDFYQKYATIDTGNYLNSIKSQLDSLENSLVVSNDNALAGLYTGSTIKGGLARNFELLKNKTEASKQHISDLLKQYDDQINNIDDDINKIKTMTHYDDRGSYIDLARTINTKLNSFRSVEVHTTLSPVMTSLNDSIDNLEQIKKTTLKSDISKGMVTSEINSLKSYKENLEAFLQKGIPALPEIKIQALDRSLVGMSFQYMLSIINWWALCLAIDFTPLILMYFVVGRVNAAQYYIQQHQKKRSM